MDKIMLVRILIQTNIGDRLCQAVQDIKETIGKSDEPRKSVVRQVEAALLAMLSDIERDARKFVVRETGLEKMLDTDELSSLVDPTEPKTSSGSPEKATGHTEAESETEKEKPQAHERPTAENVVKLKLTPYGAKQKLQSEILNLIQIFEMEHLTHFIESLEIYRVETMGDPDGELAALQAKAVVRQFSPYLKKGK